MGEEIRLGNAGFGLSRSKSFLLRNANKDIRAGGSRRRACVTYAVTLKCKTTDGSCSTQLVMFWVLTFQPRKNTLVANR